MELVGSMSIHCMKYGLKYIDGLKSENFEEGDGE